MTSTDIVAGYLRDRLALLEAATPGANAARELSDLTDSAVAAMAEAALSSLGSPWAVLALGGWGARRLLPGSDLDLLVVTDAPARELRPALAHLLYPLWDTGLSVGHQVRSRREHHRHARADRDTLTATLTGRLLAGQEALARRLLHEVASGARVRRRGVLRMVQTRPREGSPYLLEPDLKEGAGGQRDLDELAWTAAVLSGAPAVGSTPLLVAGILSDREAATLERAGELITAARWEIHRLSSRPTSVLDLDLEPDCRCSVPALQGALADVHHLLLRVRARIAGTPVAGDGWRPSDGRDSSVPPRPVTPDELFADIQRGDAVELLEDAAWSHRLDDLLPGMSDLMTLRRPGLTHLYTVGAHSVRTAAEIGAALRRDPAGLAEHLRRPLAVAALLHDVGKVQAGPGHASRGADVVATLGRRFGLDAAGTRDTATLVREHLLLVETASAEDVHDEDVVLRAAARVGRPELVAALFELTVADSKATSPGAWTPWHAALIGELGDRLEPALAEDVEGAGIAARAETVRAEALSLLADDGELALVAFVRGASLRYLASQRAVDVVEHARLAAAASASGTDGRPRVAVTPGRAAGSWRVSVAASDTSGLFAATAGAFALSGLDILSADAYSAPGDIALDLFEVRPDTLAEVDPDTWTAFERNLRDAISSPLTLDVRLAERRRHYAPRSSAEPVVPVVSVEHTSAYATAVYVTAADRVGLLYDLAVAIAETDLDIRWAKATTRGEVVRDVFHVVDAFGEPLEDPGVLGHLVMRLRERA